MAKVPIFRCPKMGLQAPSIQQYNKNDEKAEDNELIWVVKVSYDGSEVTWCF